MKFICIFHILNFHVNRLHIYHSNYLVLHILNRFYIKFLYFFLFTDNTEKPKFILYQFLLATIYVKKTSITIRIAHTPKTDNKQEVPFTAIQMPIIIIPPMIKEIPPICWHFFHITSFFMLQGVLSPIVEFIRNLDMTFPRTIINTPMIPKTS